MEDIVTLHRIQLLHPSKRAEVEHIYRSKIIPALTGRAICRFAFTLRSPEEQTALYAQGRTKLFDAKGRRLGIVTNAKAWQSIHNYGLAIDIVLVKDTNGDGNPDTASWEDTVDFDQDGIPDWMEVVKIFKAAGWSWGGDWKGKLKDGPHFESTGGKGWRDFLRLKSSGQTFWDGNNEYVKL